MKKTCQNEQADKVLSKFDKQNDKANEFEQDKPTTVLNHKTEKPIAKLNQLKPNKQFRA